MDFVTGRSTVATTYGIVAASQPLAARAGVGAGGAARRVRLGRLPPADVLAPAIFYADRGFRVSEIAARNWSAYADKLSAEPEAARLYLPGGRAPRAGEIFRNPDLARSL